MVILARNISGDLVTLSPGEVMGFDTRAAQEEDAFAQGLEKLDQDAAPSLSEPPSSPARGALTGSFTREADVPAGSFTRAAPAGSFIRTPTKSPP